MASLAESAMYETILQVKKATGFVPSEEEQAIIEHQYRVEYLRKFETTLSALNLAEDTYVLAFGEAENHDNRCVWLISDKMLASEETNSFDSKLLEDLRSGIGVRVRLPIPRPEDEEDCPSPLVTQAQMRTDEQLQGARKSLSEVARNLLPDKVSRALVGISTVRKPSGRVPRLLILADDDIATYPFAALPVGDGVLIDFFDLVILPNITELTHRIGPPPKIPAQLKEREALVVGAPDLSADKSACWPELPHAKVEAENVAQQIGLKKAITGKDATFSAVRSKLRANAKTLRLIFFATHGISDEVNPADDGYLALRQRNLRGADLRKITLKGSPLVVLSACQSGLGKIFPGGIFGLAQAWRYSGAERVVMSLWNVSDEGSKDLMQAFIHGLVAEQLEPEIALSRAIRIIKKNTPDPAIWAAFAYYGPPS
ncbi:CHAT domain-containing protein [Mesorhizobium sp. NPDC059054]|uniref:CHAT domain-containing protein n=1 Tax=Mesorhizobium sp. NPDC059054 TaxID=3346711 RepID=UPI0036CB4755